MTTKKQLLKIGFTLAGINLLLACFSPVFALIMLWLTLVPFACYLQVKNEEKTT